MSLPKALFVVDPAMKTAELDAFNRIASVSKMRATYHLPAIAGMHSLTSGVVEPGAIIVMGSASSVHDALPWQKELGDWLKPLMLAKVPTLGICFGHQFIAHLMGGKVDYVLESREKQLGFRKMSFLDGRSGEVFVSHREYVSTPAPGFQEWGRSEAFQHDALKHETLPIWTIQPHPESMPGFIGRMGFDATGCEPRLVWGHSIVQEFLDRL